MASPRTVAHDVDYELTRLLRRSRMRGMESIVEIHPELEYAGYLALVSIREADAANDGIRATELAEVFSVHKSTMSRVLSTLEGLALIERATDPDDGRARLVRLTPEAAASVDRVRARRHGRLAEILEDWSSDDLTEFASLLARLNTSIEA